MLNFIIYQILLYIYKRENLGIFYKWSKNQRSLTWWCIMKEEAKLPQNTRKGGKFFILAYLYWYNCAMLRKVNLAIWGLPFLISSTRQELFAKVLECCFSFANKFCIRKFIFLLGNVPFVRGLRPCFIKLFQSDSEFSLSRVNFPIYLPLLLGFIKPLSLCSEQNFSHKI